MSTESGFLFDQAEPDREKARWYEFDYFHSFDDPVRPKELTIFPEEEINIGTWITADLDGRSVVSLREVR